MQLHTLMICDLLLVTQVDAASVQSNSTMSLGEVPFQNQDKLDFHKHLGFPNHIKELKGFYQGKENKDMIVVQLV